MNEVFRLDQDLITEISSAQEVIAAEKGDYTIELIGFAEDSNGDIIRENKSGNYFIMPEFEIYGTGQDERYKTIRHYIGLPFKINSDEYETPKDFARAKKAQQNALVQYRNFSEIIGAVGQTEIRWTDYVGAKMYVKLDKVEDSYGVKNEIEQFIKQL